MKLSHFVSYLLKTLYLSGDGSYQKPTKTLFVCNFDPFRTKEVDIEQHFQPYGKVINVRIRSNYSFVQFATQEDATKALEATQRR